MSPEQARGEALDERTDIWAFGCVLDETLTGRPAFHGETVEDILAAVREREPDWSLLPADTPAAVTRVLRRCLEKNADRRLHALADARIEIEDAGTAPQAASPGNGAGRRLSPSRRSRHSRSPSRRAPGCGRRVRVLADR